MTTSSLTTEAASSTTSTTSSTPPSSSSSAQATTTKIPDCPDNWITYGQSCYLFSNESLIWSDARIRCENLNGYLVEITSADEDQFLVKHANFSTRQINEKK
ncbi:killer cell lectin-like receptor subfamily E member 1, partial [Ruditapes philippinarum]|uniref:killer cell lectin-like receptor subfamily E member 1 n=1 Tax=Ruditapes philippinarum TaxID=129788 RepID=UPI00295C255D